MGQCVTIPMASENITEKAYDYSHPQSQQAKLKGSSRTERQKRDDDTSPIQEWSSSGDGSNNSTTPLMNAGGGPTTKQYSRSSRKKDRQSRNYQSSENPANLQKFFSVVKQSVGPSGDKNVGSEHGAGYHPANSPTADASSPNSGNGSVVSPRPIVLPPENAVRTRCYRLNLDFAPLHTAHTPSGPNTGPIECGDEAAAGDSAVDAVSHTNWLSSANWSRDDYSVASETNALVSTAKIFRGLTINKDGTVVSVHSRKSGGGVKTDEKSRQAAKIDKAFDMVEASVRGHVKKKKSSSNEEEEPESKMVSLVIFGEYDDMKHLVRDGARRLKEAQAMPDDALLAMNRSRSLSNKSLNDSAWLLQDHNGQRPSSGNSSGGGSFRSSSRSRNKITQSTPPKLNRHPRDRPSSNSSRREMAKNSSSSKSRKFPPWKKNQSADIPIFGGVDSDWSDALQFSKGLYSMCVCGANSVSPTSNGGTNKYGEMSGVGTGATPANEGREPGSSGTMNKVSGRWGTGMDGRDGASKDTILV